MTKERRLVVSVDEIAHVRWVCTACGAAIAFSVATARVPIECPGCRAPSQAQSPLGESALEAAQRVFADALRALVHAQSAVSAAARPVVPGGVFQLEFREDTVQTSVPETR